MNEISKKKAIKFGSKKIIAIVSVILLLLIGCGLGALISHVIGMNDVSPVYINGKLENMGELTTQKLTYSGKLEVSDGAIPFITEKGFTMWYTAEAEAGINFEDVDVEIEDEKVKITLPHADIQAVEILEDSVFFSNEKKAIFNWTQKEDVTKAISDAEKRDKNEMDYSDLLEAADNQTKTLLYKVFEDSIGNRELDISFK